VVQTSPDRAQVVVIGGGVTGCSVAYHLALAGWKDVLLAEKAQLTSGSTCHAAGLVTQFNPSPTMMRFRRYSVELYERLGVFDRLGSLRIASSPQSLIDLPAESASTCTCCPQTRRSSACRRRARRACTAGSGSRRTAASTPTGRRMRWPTPPVSWAFESP
jgi:glycine/D-amino acid oxidase-like deaminating enzyme